MKEHVYFQKPDTTKAYSNKLPETLTGRYLDLRCPNLHHIDIFFNHGKGSKTCMFRSLHHASDYSDSKNLSGSYTDWVPKPNG